MVHVGRKLAVYDADGGGTSGLERWRTDGLSLHEEMGRSEGSVIGFDSGLRMGYPVLLLIDVPFSQFIVQVTGVCVETSTR